MTTWPAPVWQAIDRLAVEDLANYRAHVFDREKFLGTARARRAVQHREQIETLLAAEPNPTAERVAHVLNPKKPEQPHPNDVTQKAQNLMYALNDQKREPLPPPPPDCPTCTNQGVLTDGTTCACDRGRFVAFVRTMTHPLTKGA